MWLLLRFCPLIRRQFVIAVEFKYESALAVVLLLRKMSGFSTSVVVTVTDLSIYSPFRRRDCET